MKAYNLMQSTRCLAIGFFVFGACLLGCSKEEKSEAASSAPTVMEQLLVPSNALGFASFNMKAPGVQNYMKSAGYKKYLESLRVTLKEGFDTYWKVLEALRLMPTEEATSVPFTSGVVSLVPKIESGVDLVGYYRIDAGEDGEVMLKEVKSVLKEGGVVFADISASNFQAVQIKPFEGAAGIDKVSKIYRDTLGIKTIYLGARKDLMVMATAQTLLEDVFSTKSGGTPAITTEQHFSKAMKSLGNRSNEMGYGYLNLATTVAALGTPQAKMLPIPALAFTASVGDSVDMRSVLLTEPQTPDQEKFFNALSGDRKGASFAQMSGGDVMALSLDGAVILRMVNAAQGNQPNPMIAMVSNIVRKIETISLVVSPATAGGPYPVITLAAASSDAQGLYTDVRGLSAMAPLPPGTSWQTKEVGDIKVESLPLQPGVSIFTGYHNNAFSISSSEAGLLKALNAPTSGAAGEGWKEIEKSIPKPLLAASIDYSRLGSVMDSVSTLAPGASGIDSSSLEAFKNMGKLSFAVGYQPGQLHIGYRQELNAGLELMP